jgi:hypothetical protein
MTCDCSEGGTADTILRRPQSLTPNEDAPPKFCNGCGRRENEWEWTDNDGWRCTGCGTVTYPPDPSRYYLCPACGDPFPELTGVCRCGEDWTDLVEAQA